MDAQDAARFSMDQISRELGQAMFVYDNSSYPAVTIYDDGTTPAFTYHDGQQGPIQLPVRVNRLRIPWPQFSRVQWFMLPGGKIDFILPKITMHCNNPAHDQATPPGPRGLSQESGRCHKSESCIGVAAVPRNLRITTDVEARPNLPLQQDSTVVRYFLGLRYNNPTITSRHQVYYLPTTKRDPSKGMFGWRSPWNTSTQNDDENQVVLYRVEFSPSDNTLFPQRYVCIRPAHGPDLLLQDRDQFPRVFRSVRRGQAERGFSVR